MRKKRRTVKIVITNYDEVMALDPLAATHVERQLPSKGAIVVSWQPVDAGDEFIVELTAADVTLEDVIAAYAKWGFAAKEAI